MIGATSFEKLISSLVELFFSFLEQLEKNIIIDVKRIRIFIYLSIMHPIAVVLFIFSELSSIDDSIASIK